MQNQTSVRLAADIGGTFTDIVLEVGSIRHSSKILTTSDAPEIAVLEGMQTVLDMACLRPGDVEVFVHGTTLATNALIERKGARVAFLTTDGFRDILEMGYEKRFDHYDLMIDAVPPLVGRSLRFGVPERVSASGEVLSPLDKDAVTKIAHKLIGMGVEAVAIGYLHGYAFPSHEVETAKILERIIGDQVTICLSHEVCPEIREYERFSTTCANAAVRPLMSGYLLRLKSGLESLGMNAPIYLMMSGGGLTTLENAAQFPVRLVESGPAGGALLASHVARENKLHHVLAFDMGGTTAKICLIENGIPERAHKFEIARTYKDMKGSGWPVRIPVIEMVEIGAGGGSIARVDELGRIAVGPDSAGSKPGPAAYSLGGRRATVTDANIVLGKIDPDFFAGGKISLDKAAAQNALQSDIGDKLSLPEHWSAAGVIEIVEENMANAARVHAIERGKDINICTMVAFGGGAPLHACRLADKMGIGSVIIPPGAGVGSAIGFLKAPIAYEVTRSVRVSLDGFDPGRANILLDQMHRESASIVIPALNGQQAVFSRIVDMRYIGQGHEIRISLPDTDLKIDDMIELREKFEQTYETIYGLRLSDMNVEIVTWAVTCASVETPYVAIEVNNPGIPAKPKKTNIMFDSPTGKMVNAPVYWRADLAPGFKLNGPTIIAENETSTVVTSLFSLLVDQQGNLQLSRIEGDSA
ncbi:MAG: hydantoinase/oxoprolinase family protein [Cohaesibacteraceae bacterium]|nr:hydantoinase/oxoprolinase family protein [Cohaesibacteraceae bacterium]